MANQTHIEAEKKREQGDLEEALILTDQSLLEYQKAHDYAGMAEILSSRYLTLSHLHDQTSDSAFLTLALGAAHDSFLISQMASDQSAQVIPLYNFAKSLEKQGKLPEAVERYKQAIDQFRKSPPASHNQPAVLLDMQIHLGICELKNKDISAYERVAAAIEQLKLLKDDPYRIAVWVSGAHLKLAEILKDSDRPKSLIHLDQATQIIQSREDMTIRNSQLQNLKKQFGL